MVVGHKRLLVTRPTTAEHTQKLSALSGKK